MKNKILLFFSLIGLYQLSINSMAPGHRRWGGKGGPRQFGQSRRGPQMPATEDIQEARDKATDLIDEANKLGFNPTARQKIKQAIEILRPFAPATGAAIINIYNNRIQQLMDAKLYGAAQIWLKDAKADQATFKLSLGTLNISHEKFDDASKKLSDLEGELKKHTKEISAQLGAKGPKRFGPSHGMGQRRGRGQ